MPPVLPPAIAAAGSSLSNHEVFSFTADVLINTFLCVLVVDAGGAANTLTAITDTAGNTYTVDSAVNQPDGGGDVYFASTVTTHAITTADTMNVQWDFFGWDPFYVLAVAFTEAVTGLDAVGTPHGTNYGVGGGSLSISTTPSVNDLLIACATYETAVTNDSGHGWTDFLPGAGDGVDNFIALAWQVASVAGPVSFDTSSAGASGSFFGAAQVCAYSSTGGGGGGGGTPVTGPGPTNPMSIGAIESGVVGRPH